MHAWAIFPWGGFIQNMRSAVGRHNSKGNDWVLFIVQRFWCSRREKGGDGKTRATMHTSGQKKYKHSLFTHRNRIPKHFKWIVNGTRLHQLALTMSLIQMKFAMWHWSIRTVVFARKCLYTIFIFICIFISVSISLFCVITATTFFSFLYEVCCVCAFFRHYQ